MTFRLTPVALLLPVAFACATLPAVAADDATSVATLSAQVRQMAEQLRQVSAAAAGQQQAIAELKATNAMLVSKLGCALRFTTATDFVFDGCNVHVRNGLGQTRTTNRLGNLIIGYNKNEVSTRTGSHNLVIGDLHEYTSTGGIVTGIENTLSAPDSVILASGQSTSDGTGGAAIIGADRGDTHGNAVLIGGSMNYASVDGRFGVVVGGLQNGVTASGAVAVAGTMNIAQGPNAITCGGAENIASGAGSMACGGDGNQSPGDSSIVLGGVHNVAAGRNSVEASGANCSTGAVDNKFIVGLLAGGGCTAIAN